MTSPSLRLLARIAPLLAAAATACGGDTTVPVGNTGRGDGGSAGSGSTTGGASGRAPHGGQAGASAGGTTGVGGSAGTGTAGTTSAGTGGTTAGTGGTTTGTGGTTTGTGGTSTGDSGAGGASNRCKVLSGCGDVCYERVDGEVCLALSGHQEEVFARLGCTGQTWGSQSTTPTSCCYLIGECGVGRPITVDGIGIVAGLVRGEGW